MARRGDPIDGVMLLDKPLGMSSNAALQTVRRLVNAQKAGHTGTLDPMATGLLPLCFGNATKFSADLLHAEKGYVARVKLGEVSSTGDAEGEIVERHPVDVTAEALEEAVAAFLGEIVQIPPMYSALKVNGKCLYQLKVIVFFTDSDILLHQFRRDAFCAFFRQDQCQLIQFLTQTA